MLNRLIPAFAILALSSAALGASPATTLLDIQPLSRSDGLYLRFANLTKKVLTVDYLSIDLASISPLEKVCLATAKPGEIGPGEVRVLRIATRRSLVKCMPTWRVRLTRPEETKFESTVVPVYLLAVVKRESVQLAAINTWKFAAGR